MRSDIASHWHGAVPHRFWRVVMCETGKRDGERKVRATAHTNAVLGQQRRSAAITDDMVQSPGWNLRGYDEC